MPVRHLVAVAGLLWGCNQSDFGGPDSPSNPEGPGSPAWGDSDIACASDSDCHAGEVCHDSVCQIQRCGDVETYHSLPPIGEHKVFFYDRELALADGADARGFSPSGASDGSWHASGTIVDVAGGNFFGRDTEQVAVVVSGSNDIIVPAANERVSAGFAPVAIAAGDLDRDGLDDVVALSAGGQAKVCHLEAGSCDAWNVGGTGIDVTIGDVDGDRRPEPVFLVDRDGTQRLVVWNAEHAVTGEAERIEATLGRELKAISAGDHDGNGRAEVVGLEEGGYFDWADDTIAVYAMSAAGAAEIGAFDVYSGSLDVAHADLDHDRKDELLLLRSDPLVETFAGSSAGNLTSRGTATPSGAGDPTRITAIDLDGDSPSGTLMGQPELIPGEIVPTVLLYMPPFYKSRSPGPPWIWLGDQMNMGTELSDTITLDVGVTVGVDLEFPTLFEAELATSVSQEVEATHKVETEVVIGDQFFIEADPEAYGEDYAAVVLSCGCFHAYTYEMDDPASMTGADGRRFVVLVPVGGQTTMWSSKRYNAMVRALGNRLPEIVVPHRVGDPTSYPEVAERADGSPIPAEDMLFPDTPTVRVSDVGEIGWGLIRNEIETNEVATTTTIDVEGAVTVAGFRLGGHAGAGAGQGYGIFVGSVAEFLGAVPPVPDDPATPEDEYQTYAFTLRPHVYRQHYQDANGNDAAYYVLNYSVGF